MCTFRGRLRPLRTTIKPLTSLGGGAGTVFVNSGGAVGYLRDDNVIFMLLTMSFFV